VVLARDKRFVKKKIEELEKFKIPYIIICGENMNHPNVKYRFPKGKYDAINYSINFIPKDVDIIIFNDVDTRILCIHAMLKHFDREDVGMVYSPELVVRGPQSLFFKIFNPVRKRIPLAASGELLMIRRRVLEKVLPLKPCKAEDTHMMFKVLNLGYKVVQHNKYCVLTIRTASLLEEEKYKARTVLGIYQAVSYGSPVYVKVFYTLLPFISVILILLGKVGYYWLKGIIKGFVSRLKGDFSGKW